MLHINKKQWETNTFLKRTQEYFQNNQKYLELGEKMRVEMFRNEARGSRNYSTKSERLTQNGSLWEKRGLKADSQAQQHLRVQQTKITQRKRFRSNHRNKGRTVTL